ncbi:MAG: hypothetical protein AAF696_24315, partial [Bacteroidota bacterium]
MRNFREYLSRKIILPIKNPKPSVMAIPINREKPSQELMKAVGVSMRSLGFTEDDHLGSSFYA